MTDLWPDDLLDAENFPKSPVSILREQADFLSQKTENILRGVVVPGIKMFKSSEFSFSFNILAPTIKYSYKVFSIEYKIDLFPLYVISESRLHEEIRELSTFQATDKFIRVDSEEDYLELLSIVFRSDRLSRIISGIIAQLGDE